MALNYHIRTGTSEGYTIVDLPCRLHDRGTDFKVFANTGYEPDINDTPLLRALLEAMINDPWSGIIEIRVTAYSLNMARSMAVSVDEIRSRIEQTIRSLGKTPKLVSST